MYKYTRINIIFGYIMKITLFTPFVSNSQKSSFLQSLYLNIKEKSTSFCPLTYIINVTVEEKAPKDATTD